MIVVRFTHTAYRITAAIAKARAAALEQAG
jgi:hypothetical protein